MKVRRRCGGATLAALKELGPSTIEMVSLVTSIPKKDLRQAIGILRRDGLVDMLVGDSRTFFYQLNQSMSARNAVARKLECSADELAKPLLRRQDRYHNQWCEYWSWQIRKRMPDANVVRDYDLASDEVARNVLLIDQIDYELLPDFLLTLPNSSGSQITIAFEIERTRKANNRLIRKFKRYLEETRIDGLVYVCDSGRLAETLRELYETRVITNAERVKHYAKNFFLFSDSLSADSQPLSSFHNVNGEQVSLIEWCRFLSSVDRTRRRDADFKHA